MNVEQRPFGLRDKLAYMCGDIANDLTFIMSAFFLMLFYTNVLGIPGYVVGLLFLCSRIIDAFTDVGMGKLVDTLTPAKDGRFKCWIRRIAPFVCISGFLLFLHIVKDWSYPMKLAYIIITYIVWGSFFYTAINIPYGSMASVISNKPEDRASLSIFRSVGANIAVMFISFLIPIVVYENIDGKQVILPERFTMIAGIFVVFAFILYRICYKYTIERVQLPTKQHKRENCLKDVKDIFRSLSSNKALMILIIAAIILLLANLLIGTMNPYLYVDYFNSKLGLSVGGLLSVVGTFLLAPFTRNISNKYGKEAAAIFSLFSSFIYLSMYFIKIENVWTYITFAFFGLMGINFFMLIIWAFITDIIDNQEVKENTREDGTIYAVYSFARKVGQALAGGLGGFALSAVGYTANVPQQTEQTLNNIYGVATLVPAISCFLLFLILQFWYPLSKLVIAKNVQELETRRNQPMSRNNP